MVCLKNESQLKQKTNIQIKHHEKNFQGPLKPPHFLFPTLSLQVSAAGLLCPCGNLSVIPQHISKDFFFLENLTFDKWHFCKAILKALKNGELSQLPLPFAECQEPSPYGALWCKCTQLVLIKSKTQNWLKPPFCLKSSKPLIIIRVSFRKGNWNFHKIMLKGTGQSQRMIMFQTNGRINKQNKFGDTQLNILEHVMACGLFKLSNIY